MTQRQPMNPIPDDAEALSYQQSSTFASDRVLDSLRATRPLANMMAIVLFIYSAAGGAAAVIWVIDFATKLIKGPPPAKPYITAWSVNILFVPIALVGGVIALRYARAAGEAIRTRAPADAQRALAAMHRAWLWAGAAAVTVFLFAAAMMIAAVLTGEWPG